MNKELLAELKHKSPEEVEVRIDDVGGIQRLSLSIQGLSC